MTLDYFVVRLLIAALILFIGDHILVKLAISPNVRRACDWLLIVVALLIIFFGSYVVHYVH